ncbi:MAG: hypothetical protein HZC41_01545 [Chloroflexi bacterium]|nr:hypothetical protein [Chloroflexota bacterium]
MTLFRHLWLEPAFQHPALSHWSLQVNRWSAHRAVPWLLFALGLLRALVSLLACRRKQRSSAVGAGRGAFAFMSRKTSSSSGRSMPGCG